MLVGITCYPQGITVPIPIIPVISPTSQLLQAITSFADLSGKSMDLVYDQVRQNSAAINALGDGKVTWFLPIDSAVENADEATRKDLLKCTTV